MKRSEAVTKLIRFTISPVEIIKEDLQGVYRLRAEKLLKFIEDDLGMSPPDWDNSVFGYSEGFITPPEWEPEDED